MKDLFGTLKQNIGFPIRVTVHTIDRGVVVCYPVSNVQETNEYVILVRTDNHLVFFAKTNIVYLETGEALTYKELIG